MIDIQLLRDDPALVKKKSAQKQVDVDVDGVLKLDGERLELIRRVEDLRQERNKISSQMKGGKPDPKLISESKKIKTELTGLETQLSEVEKEFFARFSAIPNLGLDHVPVGQTEDDNVVKKSVGKKPVFDFTPRPHWEIAEQRDLFDKKRAAKVSGSRFVYLKGELVRLQLAIMQYVMDALTDEKTIEKLITDNGLKLDAKLFTPVLPPAVLRTEPYKASARLNAEETTYGLADDDLWLNASAEHTLCTMYWNEVLPSEQLPIRYIGYSTSFRREAGTYGKDTEGIIRLHQFDKLEMEVFSTAATGYDEHMFMIAIQEHFMQQLGLHYNFVEKSTADIGGPNASGVDLDCWFPGQDRYIETHTADYMTDYQARDLNTRTKQDGKVELVHTNDATAFALGRIMAAIIENYQNEDGTIRLPKVLQKYMGDRKQI